MGPPRDWGGREDQERGREGGLGVGEGERVVQYGGRTGQDRTKDKVDLDRVTSNVCGVCVCGVCG